MSVVGTAVGLIIAADSLNGNPTSDLAPEDESNRTETIRVVERPNSLRSGSASYSVTNDRYLSTLGGPRLGNIGCYTEEDEVVRREWMLRYDWQISSNMVIQKAVLDLSSMQQFATGQASFSEEFDLIRPFFVAPVEHPADWLFEASTSLDIEASAFKKLPGAQSIAVVDSLQSSEGLKEINLTPVFRTLHREGRSSISLLLGFCCSCLQDLRNVPGFHIFGATDPILVIDYSPPR